MRARTTLRRVIAASGLLLLVLRNDAHAHPGSTFQAISDQILVPTCLAGCHGSSGNGGMLVDPPDESSWYGALVNRAPANAAAAGFGKLRVDPARPWNSLLLDKLTGDLKLGEGDPMPQGSHGYVGNCPGGVELIKNWILAGAPHSGIVQGDVFPGLVVCDKQQPGLTAPSVPGDGVQLAGASFTVERPAREGEQVTTVPVGLASSCDNNQRQCFITGIDVVASAGTEYVTVSRAGESVPIAVARGELLSLSLPAGVGVPIAAGQQLDIRQRIRNDYWVGPAPYANKTTGSVYVNVHVAADVANQATPFQDDSGSRALFVPPQSYGATGGAWLAKGPGSPGHATVSVWSDRRALSTELLDATGKAPSAGLAVAQGYTDTSGPPIAYSCVYANGWVPNRIGGLGSNGSNATLNTVTGPVDPSAPLKWGCEQQSGVPAGLPALLGGPSTACVRSSDSSYSGNDCNGVAGTERCQPANLVFGMGADDGRCTLVGLEW